VARGVLCNFSDFCLGILNVVAISTFYVTKISRALVVTTEDLFLLSLVYFDTVFDSVRQYYRCNGSPLCSRKIPSYFGYQNIYCRAHG
jgi:hypothetical protein